MNSIIKEFRDFILQGDVITLAVAFIMGLAFKDVVDVFTNGIVMQFLAALFGKPDFSSIGLDIGDSRLLIGSLINAIINLIIIGAAVFFFIVKPVRMIKERQAAAGEPVPEPEDIILLREIRDSLRAR